MNKPALSVGHLQCRTAAVKLSLTWIFMTSKSVILFPALAIIMFLGALSTYIFGLERVFGIEGTATGPFVARVKLETNCEITNDAFAVHNLRTKENTSFRYEEAFVRARAGDQLKLVVHEDFPNFELNSAAVDAQKQLVMSYDCNNSPRLDGIFSSMNEQFGTQPTD